MQSYNLSKLNIVILENNKLIRRLMSNVFQEFGVRKGMSTGNPDDAYDLFTNNHADIIISDWSPELDGIEFMQRLRSTSESPDPFVPVIICTGNTEKQHVYTARDAGMTEFLVKPVSARTIYGRIVSVIEKHRPFIRNDNFFGPDRRRRNIPDFGVERRSKTAVRTFQ